MSKEPFSKTGLLPKLKYIRFIVSYYFLIYNETNM